MSSVSASAAPPRVVKASPDHGDNDVDPGLKEIRIEFDQAMSSGGHSICGGGPNFPMIDGKPRWESDRVFVIPVKLEANHRYDLSVNCPSATNFRSKSGEAAEIYAISFTTGAGQSANAGGKAAKLTLEQNRAAIAVLRRGIDENYSYRDLRKVDWEKLFKESTPKLEATETAAAFAREVGRLLAAAQDIHISVWAGDASFRCFQRTVEANINLETLKTLVPHRRVLNPCVTTGRFDDGIGYIMLSSWSAECRDPFEPA